MNISTHTQKSTLYRMVMPKHVCPYGLKARFLLKRKGYSVDDHWLKTRDETDRFQKENDVDTTPQIFIDGKRIGGYDNLRQFFGLSTGEGKWDAYRPVLTIFVVALLMSVAVTFAAEYPRSFINTIIWFVSFSMCLLAMTKLQDVEKFSTMFLNYDLLAKKWVPYSYIYPFAELIAGLLMITGKLSWLSAPVALFIGLVGAISVFKAVYIDKRELKCACVGGSSNVPLGFISLTENLMMIAMGTYMFYAI